jgi:hypothetical protein
LSDNTDSKNKDSFCTVINFKYHNTSSSSWNSPYGRQANPRPHIQDATEAYSPVAHHWGHVCDQSGGHQKGNGSAQEGGTLPFAFFASGYREEKPFAYLERKLPRILRGDVWEQVDASTIQSRLSVLGREAQADRRGFFSDRMRPQALRV